MGFSTIGAGIVLFIGMLFVASTVLSASFDGQRSVMDAIRDDRQRDRFERDTEAEISSGSIIDENLTLEILNTGGTPLNASLVQVLFDGQRIDPQEFTRDVEGSTTDVWAPGETLTLTKSDVTPETEPARVFVVLETGKGLIWINA